MKKDIFVLISATVFTLLLSCKKTRGNDVNTEPDAPGVTNTIGIPNGIPVSKTIGNAGGSFGLAVNNLTNLPVGFPLSSTRKENL